MGPALTPGWETPSRPSSPTPRPGGETATCPEVSTATRDLSSRCTIRPTRTEPPWWDSWRTAWRRSVRRRGGQYLEYVDTAWKHEQFTMPADSQRVARHINVGHQVYQEAHMEGRLYIGGTETSTVAGGFMEGAVNSANINAEKIANL